MPHFQAGFLPIAKGSGSPLLVQIVKICTSHSLTVSASTALLGGTRTVVCSVYLFRHICVCPRWATSLRGARGPVPHERCDFSALIVGCIARAAYCGGGVKKRKAPRPAYGAEGFYTSAILLSHKQMAF